MDLWIELLTTASGHRAKEVISNFLEEEWGKGKKRGWGQGEEKEGKSYTQSIGYEAKMLTVGQSSCE